MLRAPTGMIIKPRWMRSLFLIVLVFALSPNVSATKYAGEFLRLGMGARPWALGGAYVALVSDATSVYWNPANLARVKHKNIALMHSETFGSLLNYDAVTVALPSSRSTARMTIGFGLFRLGGGGIKLTALANPSLPVSDSNRVVEVGETGHSDWALYASVGREVSSRMNAGASVKIIYRDLVDVTAIGFGIDAGVTYKLHPLWNTSIMVNDITTTLLAYNNGTKESINPRMSVGLSFAPRWDRVAVTMVADGVLEFEGRRVASQFYQGPISLDVRWGTEVLYRNRLALRGGMNAENPTLGIGIMVGDFTVDGAWRGHDSFADSYRFSISHSW